MPAFLTQIRQDATDLDGLPRQVTIIDPVHPLYGRTFPVVRASSPRGKSNLILLLPDGQPRSVPRSATDFDGPTEQPPAARPLPLISVRTILPVAQLVQSMLLAIEEGHHDTSTCPTDQHTCTAASAVAQDTDYRPTDAVDRVRPASPAATRPTSGRTDQTHKITTRPRGGQQP